MRLLCILLFFLPSVAVAAPGFGCTGDGMLAWWPFEEGSGIAVADHHGSAAGTLLGGTGWAFGPRMRHDSYALSFDGRDDAVRIDGVPLSLSSTFSVSVWLQSSEGNGAVVSQLGVSGRRIRGWGVHLYPNGALAASVFGAAGSLDAAIPTQVLDGRWHHLAIIFLRDGDMVSSVLFVDGAFAGATDVVKVGSATLDAPVILGSLPGSKGVRGLLADLRVYSRALHTQDIVQLYEHCGNKDVPFSIPTPSNAPPNDAFSIPSPPPLAMSSQRLGGGRHGRRSDMVLASVHAVVAQWPLGQLRHIGDPRICALQRTLGPQPDADVLRLTAQRLSELLSVSEQGMRHRLSDPRQCAPRRTDALRRTELIPFPIDSDGLPISTSATWNRCIRTDSVSPAMVRQNTDLAPADARGTRMRPKTCGDYALGDDRWRHPDFPALEYFTLCRKPKTLLFLPQQYVPILIEDSG